MRWRTLHPTHGNLSYHNVLHRTVLHQNGSERAVFDRCFPGEQRCDSSPELPCCVPAMLQAPGATIALVTNAVRIRAQLEYFDCRASCVGLHPVCYSVLRQCTDSSDTAPTSKGHCSSTRSHAYCVKHGKVKCGGACRNHCEPKVYVDGVRRDLPVASILERYDGLITLELLAFERPRERRIEMVMPWGGQVRFGALQVFEDESTPRVTVRRAPLPHGFTYVAYGDSLTNGMCADTPYPELIGRLNRWNVLNMGLSGILITPRHGADMGVVAERADLISVLIGTNDQFACEIGASFGLFLDKLRGKNPSANVVVVTQLIRNDEGLSNATKLGHARCATVDEHREQLRAVVRARQTLDGHLHLVEGKSLLSTGELVDGVHPRDGTAMMQLAQKLNAEFHRLGLATRFLCYAQHNPDLREAYCRDDQCDYAALMAHWEHAGRTEGRMIDCASVSRVGKNHTVSTAGRSKSPGKQHHSDISVPLSASSSSSGYPFASRATV